MAFAHFSVVLLSGATLLAAPQQAQEDAVEKQLASIEKQRQALRALLGAKADTQSNSARSHPVAYFIDPMVPVVSQPAVFNEAVSQIDCPRLGEDEVSELITSAAQKQDLNPALLRAVMRQESAFKPCAISVKGAQGLMQLMPATARELHVSDVFDPVQNVHAGAAYLKQLLNRYNGDVRLALVGYNAGPGRADQSLSVPYPLETQNYVETILAELGVGPAPKVSVQPDQSFALPVPIPSPKTWNPIRQALGKQR